MLVYCPDDGLYIAHIDSLGYASIDSDSSAYRYCELVRSRCSCCGKKDPDGDYVIVLSTPEYVVKELMTLFRAENLINYYLNTETL